MNENLIIDVEFYPDATSDEETEYKDIDNIDIIAKPDSWINTNYVTAIDKEGEPIIENYTIDYFLEHVLFNILKGDNYLNINFLNLLKDTECRLRIILHNIYYEVDGYGDLYFNWIKEQFNIYSENMVK